MDEAFALPTEKAVKIALRTQQIIAHESGVTNTIDPLAGSYYLEYLTNHIEEEAIKYIGKIDDMGGMLVAIERGYVQREIENSAYLYQKGIEKGDIVIVGVNEFRDSERQSVETLKVDPGVERKQNKGLAQVREDRDPKKVKMALDEIGRVAATDENMMPYILDAVKNYVTLGEICEALKDIFGVYGTKGS